MALNKPARQFKDLFWENFTWTADKAVDGCVDRDFPDLSQCCSCNVGGGNESFWIVDLEEQFSVVSVVAYGRDDDGRFRNSYERQ